MGSPEPSSRSLVLKDHTTSTMRMKIVKKKAPKTRKPSQKYRDGLFKAIIPPDSELMEIAEANSVQSPLLSLPGEIRNQIWQYAVGYHQINIHDYSPNGRWDIRLTNVALPLEKGPNTSTSFVSPTFAVPKVCRQMYVETSPMVYKLNNFGFDNLDTFDRWIKDRSLGQRRLIMSLDIPVGYYSLYRGDFRKCFRRTFPGITRVGLHLIMAEINQRVVPGTWSYNVPIKEPIEDVKKRFVDEVKKKEGEDIKVDWYNGTTASSV